jgi:hypothetical protein
MLKNILSGLEFHNRLQVFNPEDISFWLLFEARKIDLLFEPPCLECGDGRNIENPHGFSELVRQRSNVT